MEIREQIYTMLWTNQPLMKLVGNQLIVRGSLEALPETLPMLTYTLATSRKEPAFDGPRRHDLVLFAHDQKGDYLQIDQILTLVEAALAAAPAVAGKPFIKAEFVERSGDLVDPALLTFYRSSRHQIVSLT